MPPRTSVLPMDPSTTSLPPAYETVDLGSPHSHSEGSTGAPGTASTSAAGSEHQPLSGRILGWLGGTEDDADAYRSYSYFPHSHLAATHPTAVATVHVDDEIPWNSSTRIVDAVPVDAGIPLQPVSPLPPPMSAASATGTMRTSTLSPPPSAAIPPRPVSFTPVSPGNTMRISEDARIAQTLQQQEYAWANSTSNGAGMAELPPGYTRPGTYNAADAATTGVQTVHFPRNSTVAANQRAAAVPVNTAKSQEEEEKKLKKHRPWFIWTVSLIQVGTLIASLFINHNMTGEWIQTQPVWNYMIGPTSGTLIRMGARFTPCIRPIPSYTTNATSPYLPACPLGDPVPCNIQDVCGLDGTTDQWYRFILAIFLHGGVVHLFFNLLFQIRVGAAMERDFGSFRIGMIYMLSGVAGFVFGANINAMLPSVGCSGALFGLVACLLLDLLQNWKLIVRPWFELFKLVLVILLSFALGLLPYIDNFAHIGGFVVGIFAGLIFLPTIAFGKWERRRKWILVCIAIPCLVGAYFGLFWVFYNGTDKNCTWCRYLDCLPVLGWCDAIYSA